MKTNKEYISFSELQAWEDCKYKHKLKYVDKIYLFSESVYNNFGTAIHASLEDYLLTRDMKYELALSYIYNKWKEYNLPDVGEWMNKANEILNSFPRWLDDKFPGWEPIGAEIKLYEALSEHPDVFFYGYIDAAILWNKKIIIMDYKTAEDGWKDYKKKDKLIQAQLVFYNYFWSRKHNLKYDDIDTGFVILNRAKDALQRIDYYSIKIDDEQRKVSLKVLNDMVSGIKKRKPVIPPMKYYDMKYGVCKFCEYNNTRWCR